MGRHPAGLFRAAQRPRAPPESRRGERAHGVGAILGRAVWHRGAERGGGRGFSMSDGTLHFEAAINPYGCSQRAAETLERCARAKQYRFYGEKDAATLRERLAAHHDL